MAKTHAIQPPSSILQPHPILIAGPTAVGKSKIALALAETIGGEIISVDSMQVYRGLDIGTAKSGAADRQRVLHHLIDVLDLTESFDAAEFVALARQAVAEIQSRGRVPILCGGTGFYFKAFLEGLGESPPSNPRLRAELEATLLADLLCELEQRDPATFARIDRKNLRRVIRAVEVIRLTSKPFSAQRAAWNEAGEMKKQETILALMRQPKDLHSRINARVDRMFAAGLVEETRRLLGHGLEQNPTAMQAIGYRQVVEFLRGDRALQETIDLVKIRTRQFAKRQITWFRKQANVKTVELSQTDGGQQATSRILSLLRE